MPQRRKKKNASNWTTTTATVVVRNTEIESNLPEIFLHFSLHILPLFLNSFFLFSLPLLNPSYQENSQEDSLQEDVLACLDELDTLVSVASISETDCIVGIKKADHALEQCVADGDLQCAILMKRAQLLKSVVSFGTCSRGGVTRGGMAEWCT